MNAPISLSLISAITFGKDIVGRLSKTANRDEIVNRWTKIGLVVSGIFSIVLALIVPSVVRIWYTIGTCIVPGLLVPLLASYFERLRIPARFAFAAMLSGWLTSTASLVHGHWNAVGHVPQYLLGIEPMYPGLLVSLAVWSAGRFSMKLGRP